jgi:lysophospholipase L1-like esterase
MIGFGASSMEGADDDEGGGFFTRIQPLYPQVRFINMGVGGESTRDMLQRISQVKAHQPYDLIVLLGCNDFPRANDEFPEVRASLEEYARNLSQLLADIRGQRNILITSFPVDTRSTGVQAQLFETYIDRAKAIALVNGFEIIDLYAKVKASNLDFLSEDGMHFNSAGHQYIADLVQTALNQGKI